MVKCARTTESRLLWGHFRNCDWIGNCTMPTTKQQPPSYPNNLPEVVIIFGWPPIKSPSLRLVVNRALVAGLLWNEFHSALTDDSCNYGRIANIQIVVPVKLLVRGGSFLWTSRLKFQERLPLSVWSVFRLRWFTLNSPLSSRQFWKSTLWNTYQWTNYLRKYMSKDVIYRSTGILYNLIYRISNTVLFNPGYHL